ncbi:hypothetical protein [Photorhabdus sp. SF281]
MDDKDREQLLQQLNDALENSSLVFRGETGIDDDAMFSAVIVN